MSPSARYSGSNTWFSRVLMRGPLTDKRIAAYERAGYYTLEARQARADYRKRMAVSRRRGNFVEVDGRLIYSP